MIFKVIKKEEKSNLNFQHILYKSSNLNECYDFIKSRTREGDNLLISDSFDEIVKRRA